MPGQIPDQVGTNSNTDSAMADEVQSLLRAKNIKEHHSLLSTAGSLCWPNGIAIESGSNVMFKNKGLFDGKWIIQKVTINITEGKLVTEIDFRKCIEMPKGYKVKYLEQPASDK